METTHQPPVLAPADSTRNRTAPRETRFEVLPFRKSEEQAATLAAPLRLTVTTSPKHGVDHSLEVAMRLRRAGHAVTLHLAARMVRDEKHLQEILERSSAEGIDDLFVIGGDAPEPLGPYTEAAPVVEYVSGHALRPARLGIAAYPEGHPLISDDALEAALFAKALYADYLVTQLCFDSKVLIQWLDRIRAQGIDLPLYIGAVGTIERRRLLEISAKIGVGPSLRFLRKQRNLSKLLGRRSDAAARFYVDTAAHVGETRHRVAGFHLFTFNDLLGARRWEAEQRALVAERRDRAC